MTTNAKPSADKPDQRSEDPARSNPAGAGSGPVLDNTDYEAEEKKALDDRRKRSGEQKKARQEMEKHDAEAGKARAEAEKARAEAELESLSPAQRKANEADRKADDVVAKAADARRKLLATAEGEHTVLDAKVLAAPVVGLAKSAGDHMAQKFGNDPENPKLGPGIDPNDRSVRLSRITPDSPTPVFTTCPKGMEGDYLRAGWSLADAS